MYFSPVSTSHGDGGFNPNGLHLSIPENFLLHFTRALKFCRVSQICNNTWSYLPVGSFISGLTVSFGAQAIAKPRTVDALPNTY